jgi:hypothetical protein
VGKNRANEVRKTLHVEVRKVKEYVEKKEHKLSSATKRITEKNKTKDSIAKKTKERWQGRRMQGHFPHNIDEKLVGNEQSYQW